MSTPSKRRKKNDYQASPQAVRSLDFFFNKRSQPAPDTPTEPSIGRGHDTAQDEALTDEELAKKLQAEWAEEDRTASATAATALEQAKDYDPGVKNDGDELYARSSGHSESAQIPEAAGKLAMPNVAETQDEKQAVSAAPSNAFSALGRSTLSLQSAGAEEDTVSTTVNFDQNPLAFDPKDNAEALGREWSRDDGSATYSLLTRCFVLVNSTQSRIKIVDNLVNMLRTIIEIDPSSLLPAVWLATNSISPPYIDLELGLGGSAISKALKKVCGLDNSGLKTLYNKYGDAGDVAFEAKKRQSFTLKKPKPLTIKSVFDCLTRIANAKGNGSQEVKQRIVERLVQDARGAEESRYIVRTLVQHLRIGAVKTTMLIALSRAFMLSKPAEADFPVKDRAQLSKLSKQELALVWSPAEELVKACFARRPNYNDLVPTLLEIGISDELLLRCGLAMHIPLRPMLGGITRDMGEMLTKLQGRDFSCEYKYDGQRAQVHCDEHGKVTIFSRHLEVMTDKYPDLVALVPQIRGEDVSSFIMEGEVVAIDRETHELKPFQILANRARKDVVIQSVKIDVCLFAFDLMFLNGEELLDRPFRERRSLLRSLFVELPGHFTWVKSMDATSVDGEAVSEFFTSATDIKCEGIMIKVLDNLPNPDLVDTIEDDEARATLAEIVPPPPTPSKKKAKRSAAAAGPADASTSEEKKPGRRKALLATYEPDKRLDSWLKVKKDYATTSDTIDLIPIGGWHGQGRKSAWWSPILLAARDPETGALAAVTKCMSGFTDAFYKANRERYDPAKLRDDDDGGDGGEEGLDEQEGEAGVGDRAGYNTLGEKPAFVEYVGRPDVWFHPQEVWEIIFADVTLSPTYTAAMGLVSEDRGLSLRFPRFLRVREDKSIDEASTVDFLAGLYRKQEARKPVEEQGTAKGDDDVDVPEDE